MVRKSDCHHHCGSDVGWMWMVVVVEEKRGIWYLLVVDISIFLYPKSFSFFAFILILDPKGFCIFGSKRFSYLLKLWRASAGVRIGREGAWCIGEGDQSNEDT